MLRAMWRVVVLLAIASCGDNVRGNIAIVTPAAWSGAMAEFVALTPDPGLSLATADAPLDIAATPDAPGFRIILTDDAAIPLEAFRIEAS